MQIYFDVIMMLREVYHLSEQFGLIIDFQQNVYIYTYTCTYKRHSNGHFSQIL